jgi:hypothetical protein
MDGTESNEKRMCDYDNTIENSCKDFFDKLEQILPDADRNNDELFGAVADLVVTHDDIFLEVGIVVGFNLYKSLELAYHKLGETITELETN